MRATWRYRLFFGVLYFLQGSVLAYISNFQKIYLEREKGVPGTVVALFTSLLLIPFMIKVFLGVLSDRVSIGKLGGRKPFMLIGLLLCAVHFSILAFIDPATSFRSFAIVSWIAVLGLALFDTCADGWAVDVASESEQGAIQASMISGKSTGFILMSYAFGLIIASEGGYPALFWCIAGLSVVVLFVVLVVPYRAPPPVEDRPDRTGSSADFWRAILRRPFIAFAAFGVTYSIASFGTDGQVTNFLDHVRGVEIEGIGKFGTFRGLGALAGALVFGSLSSRLSLRKSLFLGIVVLGVGCHLPNANLSIEMTGAPWGLCWGFQETAYVTLAMRFAVGRWSATIFAVAMIFSNLGTSLGEALAGFVKDTLGYPTMFVLMAGIAWSAVVWIPFATGGPARDRAGGLDR